MVSKIEFRPHIAGYRTAADGSDEAVEFPQWILMTDDGPEGTWLQAGYVPKRPDGSISLIRRFSEEDRETILELVTAEKGRRGAPQQPPEMDDDDDDDGHDDDE